MVSDTLKTELMGLRLDDLLEQIRNFKSDKPEDKNKVSSLYAGDASADDIRKDLLSKLETRTKNVKTLKQPEDCAKGIYDGNPDAVVTYLTPLIKEYNTLSTADKNALGFKKFKDSYDADLLIVDASKRNSDFAYGNGSENKYVLETVLDEGGIEGLTAKAANYKAKKAAGGAADNTQSEQLEKNVTDSKEALIKYLKVLAPGADDDLLDAWYNILTSGNKERIGSLLSLLGGVEASVAKNAYSTMPKAKQETRGVAMNDNYYTAMLATKEKYQNEAANLKPTK